MTVRLTQKARAVSWLIFARHKGVLPYQWKYRISQPGWHRLAPPFAYAS